MTKIILDIKENLDKIALEIITTSIINILNKQEMLVLGVPGGRSVVGIFHLLKEAEDIPWEKVHIFMVDERFVALNNEESNFKLVKEIFTDKLIKKDKLYELNVHPFIMNKSMSDFGISEYENELKKIGSAYDIILLSIGEDGHVASLFPNHHSIKNDAPFYLLLNDSPKPPQKRMTISKNLLIKSKVAIVLVTGENKRTAYYKFLNSNLDIIDCPARLVLQIKNSYLLTNLKNNSKKINTELI